MSIEQQAVKYALALLRAADLHFPAGFDLEFSHHYGMERFHAFGALGIILPERKYLILLPGQSHPEHVHRKHTESYEVLHGDMMLLLDRRPYFFSKGQKVRVAIGVKHFMATKHGVVVAETFEGEIQADSYYTDATIPEVSKRKSVVRGLVL